MGQLPEAGGRIRSWNDDKGFGFVTPDAGGPDLFVHISAMRGERRPVAGDAVLFVAGKDPNGRLRAVHLRLAGEMTLDRAAIRKRPTLPSASMPPTRRARSQTARPKSRRLGREWWLKGPMFVLLLVLPAAACATLWRSGVAWVTISYTCASVLSFLQYWLDKQQAQRGRQRISENSLHLLELAGGWPGALIAQQAFRHKTRKVSFQIVFWVIVALHQAAAGYLWWRPALALPTALR